MLLSALNKLMGKKNRMKVAILQILFLLSAVLQVSGIVSIAPFITMISNPDIIQTNNLLAFFYGQYEFTSDVQFMTVYAVGVVVLLLLGNGVSSYSLWHLFKTSMELGAHIQKTIFSNYLSNDYSFFASNNSNQLISQITQEVPRLVYMVVQPILTLISQGFIALLIIVGLLVVDYKVALVATLIIGSSYLFIYKIVRSKMVTSGRLVTSINKQKLKLLNESIGGIKEVKLRGNESYYTTNVDQLTRAGMSANAYISLAGDLPRFVVETVVFSAILGLSIYILISSGTAGEALSIISLYAMAGYKLLPAAQSMYKSYSQIKANATVVLTIHDEVEESGRSKRLLNALGNAKAPKGAICLEDVSFKYANSSNYALKHCNLKIEQSQVTAFVGASGAGKSTAVDMLLGLLIPNSGSVTIGGQELNESNLQDWRNRIGYVAQEIFLIDATVAENIALGVPKEQIDYQKLVESARLANIYDFVMSSSGGFDFALGERGAKLSGGQRQRIGIARALYREPSVLIFDEATSALDNVTEHLIMKDVVKLAKSKTVILIAHRLSTVEGADKIAVFDSGRVVAEGSYKNLANSSIEFKKLLEAGKRDPE